MCFFVAFCYSGNICYSIWYHTTYHAPTQPAYTSSEPLTLFLILDSATLCHNLYFITFVLYIHSITFILLTGVTLFMFVNFFIVTFSMNYWRHATDGIRRYLDMFMARLGFVTYIIFGAINIRSPIILYSFIPLFVPNVLCYKYACIKWEDDSEHWCYYHMGFHLFTTIEQFLILYYYVLERNGQ